MKDIMYWIGLVVIVLSVWVNVLLVKKVNRNKDEYKELLVQHNELLKEMIRRSKEGVYDKPFKIGNKIFNGEKCVRYKNRISGVEGVLIGIVNKQYSGDILLIKTDDGREYFSPAKELDVIK
ncbi:hypothetical protein [Myroides odoratimimus]|uniref:hypothetical protein n=1 Tax=Myroides odoratimimus TaxID=76832 RepID=UPI002576C36B|nr:hypothetical protein [Myroides odoratimimus]MDM1057886.1 hypothetical protein [Myroides odoratimimus]